MFEYHGWANIRDDDPEGDDEKRRRIVEELRQVAGQFNAGSGMADIRCINGNSFVSFCGAPNHRHDCIFGWFNWLAKHAPQSYGVLHVWDDESENYGNVFRAYYLRRGCIEESTDPFLSPCIPAIEVPDVTEE